MFHPVTSALGKRYPTKLYGIHIVFNAVPVLIPVPLDELDQVIDADGFVAAPFSTLTVTYSPGSLPL